MWQTGRGGREYAATDVYCLLLNTQRVRWAPSQELIPDFSLDGPAHNGNQADCVALDANFQVEVLYIISSRVCLIFVKPRVFI